VNPNTGLLTSLGNAVPAGAAGPFDVVVDPGGQLLYVSCIEGNSVTIFSISATGALKQVGSAMTDGSPQLIVLVPR
jgi:6-phosphogluconolactonase (cycloisomerase 2 family)